MDCWYDPIKLIFPFLLTNLVWLVSQSSVLARPHKTGFLFCFNVKHNESGKTFPPLFVFMETIFPLFFICDLLCNAHVLVWYRLTCGCMEQLITAWASVKWVIQNGNVSLSVCWFSIFVIQLEKWLRAVTSFIRQRGRKNMLEGKRQFVIF